MISGHAILLIRLEIVSFAKSLSFKKFITESVYILLKVEIDHILLKVKMEDDSENTLIVVDTQRLKRRIEELEKRVYKLESVAIPSTSTNSSGSKKTRKDLKFEDGVFLIDGQMKTPDVFVKEIIEKEKIKAEAVQQKFNDVKKKILETIKEIYPHKLRVVVFGLRSNGFGVGIEYYNIIICSGKHY